MHQPRGCPTRPVGLSQACWAASGSDGCHPEGAEASAPTHSFSRDFHRPLHQGEVRSEVIVHWRRSPVYIRHLDLSPAYVTADATWRFHRHTIQEFIFVDSYFLKKMFVFVLTKFIEERWIRRLPSPILDARCRSQRRSTRPQLAEGQLELRASMETIKHCLAATCCVRSQMQRPQVPSAPSLVSLLSVRHMQIDLPLVYSGSSWKDLGRLRRLRGLHRRLLGSEAVRALLQSEAEHS